METYFENDLMLIEQVVNSYLKLTWKPATETMEDKDYRNAVLTYADAVQSLNCERIYVDTRQFLFTISPKIQDWINTEIFPKNIEAGLRRMAIMTSPDFFAQLSVEQTMDDKTDAGFVALFFEDEQKALHWLLEK